MGVGLKNIEERAECRRALAERYNEGWECGGIEEGVIKRLGCKGGCGCCEVRPESLCLEEKSD